MVGRITRWFLVFIWAGFIFYLSSIPSLTTGLGIWDLILRKIAHFGEFGIFTFLNFFAFSYKKVMKKYLLISGIIAMLYAFTDELHQAFVPGRYATALDILIDGTGVMFAMWLIVKNRKL